jgi:hypothetical protein
MTCFNAAAVFRGQQTVGPAKVHENAAYGFPVAGVDVPLDGLQEFLE